MSTGMDYAAMGAMVESLIAANGREVGLVPPGSTANVSGKPWKGVSDAFTTDPATGVLTVFGLSVDYNEREIDETNVKRGDKKFLVAAISIVDVTGYAGLRDGEEIWKVVKVSALQPGPTRLLYTFQVRL